MPITFKIVTVGLTPGALATLESLLKKNTPPAWSLIYDPTEADIGIVDLDAENSRKLFHDYRTRFSGPTLAFAARDPEIEDAIWVSTPVKTPALMAALGWAIERIATAKIAEEVETKPESAAAAESVNAGTTNTHKRVQTASTAALPEPTELVSTGTSETPTSTTTEHRLTSLSPQDIVKAAGLPQTERRRHPSYGSMKNEDYVDPAQRHLCFYDPEDYFQAALRRGINMAKNDKVPVRIVLGDDNMGISVFPTHDCVQSEVREHFLRSLSMVKMGGATIRFELLSAGTRLIGTPAEPRLQTTSTLMWKVALWSAMGRIPSGTNPEAPVKLTYWPNFTRVFLPHHAIQIAALWSKYPTSLYETAKILDIEYRYIFSFFSAAKAIDAVTFVRDKQRRTTKRDRSRQPRFSGRLLNYLGSRA